MSNSIIPQFFGSVLYWTNILSSNAISLKREVAFQKSSRMNRTEIMTANGLLLLTVPVIGGRNSRLPYSETMIDYKNSWQKNHLNALQSAYGKSAFWEFYKDILLKIYSQNFKLLIELNEFTMNEILKCIKVNKPILQETKNDVFNIETQALKKNNASLPEYFQTFSNKFNFESDISIIDLIMNTGNESRLYLEKINEINSHK